MPEELEETTGIIKEGLAKGQGLAHIYAAHGDELCFSRRTCYRLIKNGAIAITPMDLPKAVGYKPRDKKAAARETMPKDVIEGRRYADFCALDEEQHYRVVEMDCVVGPQGSHDAILTLHFKALHFQIGMKLVRKDTAHVVAAFDALYALLEHDEFRRLFGLILCDRGSEFYDVLGMEYKGDARRCSLYYCDPRRSDQKGACEKNHVELRKLLPKGTPLGNIDQWKLADAFSHINSLRRDSLYGRCPMELAKAIMPDSFLEALGYSLIDADDVFLSPKLLWPDGVPEA
jgi:IS30 family transposase